MGDQYHNVHARSFADDNDDDDDDNDNGDDNDDDDVLLTIRHPFCPIRLDL